ncbi:MAG: hypothetical protein ACLFOY_02830 [Desulfatibacillaceae bacterium]
MAGNSNQNGREERDALCPECGHAFKTFVDRVIQGEDDTEANHLSQCPVCGCGECKVGENTRLNR